MWEAFAGGGCWAAKMVATEGVTVRVRMLFDREAAALAVFCARFPGVPLGGDAAHVAGATWNISVCAS